MAATAAVNVRFAASASQLNCGFCVAVEVAAAVVVIAAATAAAATRPPKSIHFEHLD